MSQITNEERIAMKTMITIITILLYALTVVYYPTLLIATLQLIGIIIGIIILYYVLALLFIGW